MSIIIVLFKFIINLPGVTVVFVPLFYTFLRLPEEEKSYATIMAMAYDAGIKYTKLIKITSLIFWLFVIYTFI